MAAPKSWLYRLPEIVDLLRAVDAPVVDRAGFERVFSLRRRRAIQLMERFGAIQAGKSLVLDRSALINLLECMQAGEEFAFEVRRRQRLSESLERARRLRRAAEVKLIIPSGEGPRHLPDDVSFRSGVLEVRFTTAEDLLGKLYCLAQAAAADYDAFQSAAGD